MGAWAWFWAVLFVASMLVFFGLAVAVTIGGLRDVKEMFRNLRAKHERK